MTPQERKELSNARLKRAGIPIAPALPLIEDESEIAVRSSEELLQRLVALWAVAGAANLPNMPFFCEYIETKELEGWLSKRERDFLFSDSPPEGERIHFGWQIEPMYFLAWSASLIPEISLPATQSNVSEVLSLFPHPKSPTHSKLEKAISVRGKSEILDWCDLLYRAHWAVRESQVRRAPPPKGLVPGAVMEWHKAANWIVSYEGEDNWDDVGTDT